jgi:hypothetical protein
MNHATPEGNIPSLRSNPVFWLMWLLPGSAVLASFATLGVALKGADRPLPKDYHWEGERLDHDFARARAAAALGVEVRLELQGGQCRALISPLDTEPAALDLLLTHGVDAGLDRRTRLTRIAAGEYRSACAPLAPGKWRIALEDDAAQWALRGNVDGRADHVLLRARSPDRSSG